MLQLVLLIGKFLFLLVLYLFILHVVRSAGRGLALASPPVTAVPSASPAGTGLPGGSLPEGGAISQPGWSLVAASVPRMRKGTRVAVPLAGPLLAGRSGDAGLYLEDTFVSGRHARFTVTSEGLVVEDLGSTNGTFVNGSEISGPTLLGPGDQVAIGDGVFMVELGP